VFPNALLHINDSIRLYSMSDYMTINITVFVLHSAVCRVFNWYETYIYIYTDWLSLLVNPEFHFSQLVALFAKNIEDLDKLQRHRKTNKRHSPIAPFDVYWLDDLPPPSFARREFQSFGRYTFSITVVYIYIYMCVVFIHSRTRHKTYYAIVVNKILRERKSQKKTNDFIELFAYVCGSF